MISLPNAFWVKIFEFAFPQLITLKYIRATSKTLLKHFSSHCWRRRSRRFWRDELLLNEHVTSQHKAPEPITALSVSGQMVAVGCEKGWIVVYEMSVRGKHFEPSAELHFFSERWKKKAHLITINQVHLEISRLITASQDHSLKIFQPETGKILKTFMFNEGVQNFWFHDPDLLVATETAILHRDIYTNQSTTPAADLFSCRLHGCVKRTITPGALSDNKITAFAGTSTSVGPHAFYAVYESGTRRSSVGLCCKGYSKDCFTFGSEEMGVTGLCIDGYGKLLYTGTAKGTLKVCLLRAGFPCIFEKRILDLDPAKYKSLTLFADNYLLGVWSLGTSHALGGKLVLYDFKNILLSQKESFLDHAAQNHEGKDDAVQESSIVLSSTPLPVNATQEDQQEEMSEHDSSHNAGNMRVRVYTLPQAGPILFGGQAPAVLAWGAPGGPALVMSSGASGKLLAARPSTAAGLDASELLDYRINLLKTSMKNQEHSSAKKRKTSQPCLGPAGEEERDEYDAEEAMRYLSSLSRKLSRSRRGK